MLGGSCSREVEVIMPIAHILLLKLWYSQFLSSKYSEYFKDVVCGSEQELYPPVLIQAESCLAPGSTGEPSWYRHPELPGAWAGAQLARPQAGASGLQQLCSSLSRGKLQGSLLEWHEVKYDSCRLESLFWCNMSSLQQCNKQNNKRGDVETDFVSSSLCHKLSKKFWRKPSVSLSSAI